ncbi:MAG: cobalamin B12-binding domain-containing protein [Candidatus Ranarchaeia archaeon]
MEETKFFEQIQNSVIDGDREEAIELTTKYLELKKDPMICLKEALIPAMKIVAEGWTSGEFFLPDVIQSAGAMKASSSLLQAEISKSENKNITKGKIVLGTIKGDIHDIGKDLVNAILAGGLFQVIDIGVDQPPESFIEKAEEVNADIIGISCLLTIGIEHVKDLIQKMEEKGLRSKYKIIIGGGAVRPNIAKELGADGFAEQPHEIVEEVLKLINNK